MMKQSLILGAAIAGTLSTSVVMADVSGNVGIGTNYVWRGFTQTADQASIYGGLDWSNDTGVYAGTWVSNVQYPEQDSTTKDVSLNSGYELDLYAGFAGEAGDIGYDVGVISYQYPVTPDSNFVELYLTGSFEAVSVGAYFTVDKSKGLTDPTGDDDLYLTASVDLDNYSIYVGSYSFDAEVPTGADDPDYTHYGISYSKDDFTFTVDKNDVDEAGSDPSTNNVRVTVGWSKEFEL